MPTDVIMPQMGESIAEGTITRWMKKVGDTVKRDEPIFEISTDKVDAEIPSPAAGTLLEIKVPEGQTVAINTVVARIGEAGEQPAAAAADSAAAPAPAEGRRKTSPGGPAARSGAPDPGRASAPAGGSRSDSRAEGRRAARVHRGADPPQVFAARPEDRVRALRGHHPARGDRDPQPGDEERHPLLHRKPQG